MKKGIDLLDYIKAIRSYGGEYWFGDTKVYALETMLMPDSFGSFMVGWKCKPQDAWQQMKIDLEEDITPFLVAVRLS